MTLKNIASSACITKLTGQKQLKIQALYSHTQRGVTLIELMVGITIGLLTIAVAMGSLMVSRGISGTVSDASNIQQQAAYAMRVIGLQLRQAGSLRLNLNPGTDTAAEPYLAAVAFETDYTASDSSIFSVKKDTLKGKSAPSTGEYALSVGYRNYTEPVFTSASAESLQRNCLGEKGTEALVLSEFVLNATKGELQCKGSGQVQPLIDKVANFQIRYLLQDTTTTPGTSTIKSVEADGVGTDKWGSVQAVEVCLVLYGTEPIDMPAGSTYIDCDGTTKVDMTTLASPRTRRMHIAFRNLFQLRSQGLVGSVL